MVDCYGRILPFVNVCVYVGIIVFCSSEFMLLEFGNTQCSEPDLTRLHI